LTPRSQVRFTQQQPTSARGGPALGRHDPSHAIRVLLVEHGANRGGLAAARALAGAGWGVDVLGSGAGLTRRSRSVRSFTPVDWPGCGPEGLAAAVRDTAARRGSDLVLPVDETQLLALSEHRASLGALLPYPEHDVVLRCTDRYEQALAAEAAGLAPPRTVLATEGPPAETVVVKARTPRLHAAGAGWGRFETRIGPAAQARSWVAEIEAAGGEAVLQEPVEGRLVSMSVLLDSDGRLLAQVQQRAERIWPPGAGTSARARTVHIDPHLGERVLAFLGGVGWHGLAQLQFLAGDDGRPRLIDLNPRFYGSLALAIGAGADLPSLWAAAALGSPPASPVIARAGMRYQWLGGDLRRAVRERRGGLARDVGATLRWGSGAIRPVWSAGDPGPGLDAALRLLRSRV
jgi:predicted ATP-grasp superfamily ATP-dependent carboligase